MGPLNSSGEFIWVASYTGRSTPYLYVEGVLRTSLRVNEVYDALDSTLAPEEYRSGRSYQIPSAKVFRRFIVRDDKRCALLAITPIEVPGVSVVDRFGEMAEDLRRASEMVSGALGAERRSVLDFEMIGCQAMLPYG